MLTPKEMLHKGVFGGIYFNNYFFLNNFPNDWFEDLDKNFYMSDRYSINVNYFNVKSGLSREEWKQKGWMHEDDPRGWFEWYCKYFLGRRHEDDRRQINRWLAFCGPKGRWRRIIYSKIYSIGCGIIMSKDVSRKIQQSLLHWSYIVNEYDYKVWKKENNMEYQNE
tara:strand:+ start:3301 stop:3798 length:498 start_codon:yes stop_codon:yes gene_type:complete